jgi:hypothetical protein
MMNATETAKQEAAKQAVILVAGLVSLAIMWPLYRRMLAQQADQLRGIMPRDSALSELEDRERARMAAKAAARRWDAITTVMFRYGPRRGFAWAWGKAEAAHRTAGAP